MATVPLDDIDNFPAVKANERRRQPLITKC